MTINTINLKLFSISLSHSKKAQTGMNTISKFVLAIGGIAIVLVILVTVLSSIQTETQVESTLADYTTYTDTNVTFTAGYADLSSPYCTSIDAVQVP